jgi:hypothetical protein
VPAYVANEIDTDSTRPLVVEIAEEAERTQMALEFFAEERGALAAARVAGSLGTEEDEGAVRGWARG